MKRLLITVRSAPWAILLSLGLAAQEPVEEWPLSVDRVAEQGLRLSWPSLGEGYVYTVEFRQDLVAGEWQRVSPASQWPVAGTSWVADVQAGLKARFYRVVGELPFDPSAAPEDLDVEVAGVVSRLSWSPVAGASGYAVYRSNDPAFPPALTTRIGVAEPALTETELAFNLPYYYRVTALGPGGEGAPSVTLPFTMRPPVLDPGAASSVSAVAAFLLSGQDPVQKGMTPGALEPARTTLLRGVVLGRMGGALAGVRVHCPDHAEWGYTLTRLDGSFALAVNGGSRLVLAFEKEGLLPAQRALPVAWQEQVKLPPVVLMEPDPVVSTVDLASAADIQVARSSVSMDQDGTRQATILFPVGTQAAMVLPDGTRQPLDTLSVRATEYTVGDAGPQAMPAELPGGTGYTYCVDLRIDEAEAAGASAVEFDRPQFVYVDNFLGFAAGTVVPSGYYDESNSTWVPSPNGLVVEILSIEGDIAVLDLDGTGDPAEPAAYEALGITDDERELLATLHTPGQSLWRVPVRHFSSFDFNWAIGPNLDAEPPQIESWVIDGMHTFASWLRPSQKCTTSGSSFLDNQAQILREGLHLTGLDFGLSYSSVRCPDFTAAFQTRFPVTKETLPPGLKRVEVEVRIAGQSYRTTYPAEAGLWHTFTWDGRDAFGRRLQGRQPATVRLGYVYDAYYQEPQELIAAFGYKGNGVPLSVSKARMEFTFYEEWETHLGSFDTRPAGLGGWTFDVHHHYDPVSRTLFQGDGTARSAASVQTTIETLGGGGQKARDSGPAIEAAVIPYGIAVDSLGNVIFANYKPWHRIQRITPDGEIETLAGGGSKNPGDGGLATEAELVYPYGLTIGPDGSVYFSEERAHRVRRIDPDGVLHPVAGIGSAGFSGDGGAATAAQLDRPQGIDLGPDGSLYIADAYNHRIRRVAPDGRIQTIVGTGVRAFGGDGGPALAATTSYPNDVAVAPDGTVYFSSWHDVRVRRIATDGTVSTVVGGGGNDRIATWEGLDATRAGIGPLSVEISAAGNLLITDRNTDSLYMVGDDQTIRLISGVASFGYSGDGGPSYTAQLSWPRSVAVDPLGDLLLSDGNHLRRIGKPLAKFGFGEIAIASLDGSRIFRFDDNGRHLDTRNALTGSVLYSFDYDADGRLSRVTDGHGNVTTVEHDALGRPVAVTAPFGQRTTLAVDAQGFLATITDPSGASDEFNYSEGGLLLRHVDRLEYVSEYAYDTLGRLKRARGADGVEAVFAREEEAAAFTVIRTHAEGTQQRYRVESLPNGSSRLVNQLDCCGVGHEAIYAPDGSATVTRASGHVTHWNEGPDPQFGMQAPIAEKVTDTTPAGLQRIRNVASDASTVLVEQGARLDTLTVEATVNGRASTAYYSATNRVASFTSPEGRQRFLVFDEQGLPVEWQFPGLNAIAITYDSRGRLASFADGTRQWTYGYGADNGFLERVTNPLDETIHYTRDLLGRVTRVNLPDGATWKTGWDAEGRPITLRAPGQERAHRFEWSAVGLLTALVSPLEQRTEWHYDRERRLARKVCPSGEEITWTYNSRGLLEKLTLPSGMHAFTYDTNSAQLVRSISADGQQIDFSYDGALLTRTSWSGEAAGVVEFSYDDNFWLVNLSYADASLELSFDDDGLLTGAGEAVIARDPENGLPLSVTQGELVANYTYDAYGAMETASVRYGEDAVMVIECGYDALGRLAWKNETVDGRAVRCNYIYDVRGRLVSVERDGVEVEHYDWDSTGNRTGIRNTLRGVNLAEENFTHDADQKLLEAGSTEFAYDANGRLARVTEGTSIANYHYRADGALAAVDLPDGREIRYRYDASHRPVARLVDGVVERRWLYGTGWLPLAEYDPDGSLRTRYEYLGGTLPSAFTRGDDRYRVVKLHATAPLLILDEAGGVVKRVDYDAWGNVVADSNPAFEFAFGWVGGIADPDTGLIRFGLRDYDPLTGRWTAGDPLLFAGVTHLYAYAESDPINNLDRSGMAVEIGIEGTGAQGKKELKSTIGGTGSDDGGVKMNLPPSAAPSGPLISKKGELDTAVTTGSSSEGTGVKLRVPPPPVSLQNLSFDMRPGWAVPGVGSTGVAGCVPTPPEADFIGLEMDGDTAPQPIPTIGGVAG